MFYEPPVPNRPNADECSGANPQKGPRALDTNSVWVFVALFIVTVHLAPIGGISGIILGILVAPGRQVAHSFEISNAALVLGGIGLFLPFLFLGIYLAAKFGSSSWPFFLATGFTAMCGTAGWFIGGAIDLPNSNMLDTQRSLSGFSLGGVLGFVLAVCMLRVYVGSGSGKRAERQASQVK